MAEPDIRILVGNLGDASPTGKSATLIRDNLQAALSASPVKAKIVLDTGNTTKANGATSLIKTVQTDSAKAEKAISSMRLQLARFNEYLTTVDPKALTQFAGQINNVRALLGSNVPTNAQKATAAINKLKAEIKSAGYEGGNAITYIQGKMKTFATYLVSSAMTMGFVNGVKTMIENVKDLDAALTDLRIVTGGTREETQELLETYNQMAQQLGTTTTSVAAGAVDWLRQGYSEEDARELLKQSMTLSIVGDMDSVQATDSLTSAMKGYKLAVEEASDVVDKFFTVDMAAATSSEDLALALAKTAANAKLAGLSLDDVIGQLAVVNEIMKEDGTSTGGTMRLAA